MILNQGIVKLLAGRVRKSPESIFRPSKLNIRELNYNKEKMGDCGYLEISTKKTTEEMLDLS